MRLPQRGLMTRTLRDQPMPRVMSEPPTPYVSFDIAQDAPTRDDSMIVIAVVILGALVAVPAFLGVVGSVSISFGNQAASGGAIASLFDLGYIVLGIGLMMRRELARQVYVVLAIVSVIFLVIGAISVWTSERTLAANGNAAVQAQIARTRSEPPSASRESTIQSLEAVAARAKADQPDNDFSGLIPGFLLALVPLVFLTRPAVKAVFRE